MPAGSIHLHGASAVGQWTVQLNMVQLTEFWLATISRRVGHLLQGIAPGVVAYRSNFLNTAVSTVKQCSKSHTVIHIHTVNVICFHDFTTPAVGLLFLYWLQEVRIEAEP